MSEDPRHAEAFARIEEVSDVLRSVHIADPPRGPAARWDRYDASIPIRDWNSGGRHFQAPWAFAGAASLLALALFAAAPSKLGALLQLSPKATVYTTTIGENRTLPLADGSTITLGGNSSIEASFRDNSRQVELERGEAFFTVAKDPARPFKVHAGKATVVAVGTEFNVRRNVDRVVVDVIEGRVVVTPVSTVVPMPLLRQLRPQLVPVQVAAGEETTVGSHTVAPATPMENVSTATSWQSGRLAFRLQPLRYVLEDLNRYTATPIVFDDERIGDMLITGTVVGNNVSGWVASLESALGVVAHSEQGRIVLRVAETPTL